MNHSILQEKSLAFAIKIVKLAQCLQKERKEYVISNQLLDAGTSTGANIREAEFAQSKKDFINKMSISLKECSESAYFLLILCKTDYINIPEFDDLTSDCGEIKAMLISSIKTAKNNLPKPI
jgi:four helix bundle protein